MSQVAPLTTEYYEMLEAVYSSPYYTEDPLEACLFLPSIDLLNLQEQVLQNSKEALNAVMSRIDLGFLEPCPPSHTGTMDETISSSLSFHPQLLFQQGKPC